MKVDGVAYQIDWQQFRVGYSFFVPCIDHAAAKKTVARIAKRLGIKIEMKVVIQEGIKGLRVWRV